MNGTCVKIDVPILECTALLHPLIVRSANFHIQKQGRRALKANAPPFFYISFLAVCHWQPITLPQVDARWSVATH